MRKVDMKTILAVFALLFVTVARASDIQPISVTSPTIKPNEPIPAVHSADGRNESPALVWSNVPSSAKELVVICEDPDAGVPPPFVHWVMYKIPATAKGLPSALPIDGSPLPKEIEGAVQGLSGFRRAIYRGPAPPPGKVHHYHFVVYAIDKSIEINPTQPPLTRAQLLEAIEGHVVGRGELVATYERK